MAALAQSLRVTIGNSAAWRTCERCGALAALPDGTEHCTGTGRKSRRAAR
ncbi:hypothetical protein WEI85_18030 [Actinomycetes bacterium KLBMP 9797]